MVTLNKEATETLNILTRKISNIGDNEVIKNNDTFMSVHIEAIGKIKEGLIVSIAHYRKQNGDLLCDPDMTFLVIDGKEKKYSPLSFEMSGIKYERSVEINSDGTIGRTSRFKQEGQKEFAEMWLRNIKEQQSLKKVEEIHV